MDKIQDEMDIQSQCYYVKLNSYRWDLDEYKKNLDEAKARVSELENQLLEEPGNIQPCERIEIAENVDTEQERKLLNEP